MNIRNTDYSRLLADCTRLYEELEGVLNSINRLLTDIDLEVEDIQHSFESIDYLMEHCTEQLRCLIEIEPMRTMNSQRPTNVSNPEAGKA